VNPGDPLAQLHPLREPAAVLWWPPAPGWWILLGLLLAALGFACFWLWRRHQRNRYRAEGLAALRAIERELPADDDPQATSAAVNALLKAVALHAYPRAEVAGIHGRDWAKFLNETGGDGLHFDEAMAGSHYGPPGGAADVTNLCGQAARWIRQHRGQP